MGTMKNIGYHRVGWFSQVYQAIPRNPDWTPPNNTGAASGSIVKRKPNHGERVYKRTDVAVAALCGKQNAFKA